VTGLRLLLIVVGALALVYVVVFLIYVL